MGVNQLQRVLAVLALSGFMAGFVAGCASDSMLGKDDARVEIAADAIEASSCRLVSRVQGDDRHVFGTEDLTVSRDLGLVFVSSTHRKAQQACKDSATAPAACSMPDGSDVGGMFVYVPGEDMLRPVTIDRPTRGVIRPLAPFPATGLNKFYPHGIDLHEEAGKRSLFMISHPWAQDTFFESRVVNRTYSDVHLFDVSVEGEVKKGGDFQVTLRERGMIYDPAWSQPDQPGRLFNDIAAVDLNRFLVTDNQNQGKIFERVFKRALSVIGEGGPARVLDGAIGTNNGPGAPLRAVFDDLSYANGIAVSPRGKVYVADSLAGSITAFDLPDLPTPPRPPVEVVAYDEPSSLPEGEVVTKLSTALDNLSWSEDGTSLLVAGHPFLHEFMVAMLSDDPVVKSGSQVYSIIPAQSGGAETIAQLFRDDGDVFSASSVVVEAGGERILGGVYGPGLLACGS